MKSRPWMLSTASGERNEHGQLWMWCRGSWELWTFPMSSSGAPMHSTWKRDHPSVDLQYTCTFDNRSASASCWQSRSQRRGKSWSQQRLPQRRLRQRRSRCLHSNGCVRSVSLSKQAIKLLQVSRSSLQQSLRQPCLEYHVSGSHPHNVETASQRCY